MSTIPPLARSGPSKQALSALFARQQVLAPAIAQTSYRQRLVKLDRIVGYLNQEVNKQALLTALKQDFRKHEVEVLMSELGVVLGHVKYIRKHLRRWMEPERVGTPLSMIGTVSYLYREPKGCVLIISPWNYPFNLTFVPLVYAIAAGCTVTVKPSEFSPATSAFMRVMLEQLFPDGEVSVVEGEGDTSAALTELPYNHVFFTGSPEIGKKVMAAAAKNLAGVTLELGGKSPCVVDRDVNIKKSARNTVWGKCFNAGQTCTAPDYLLVHEAIAQPYVRALGEAIAQFYGSDVPASPDFPRIINDRHFDRLKAIFDDAVAKGATVAYGGEFDRPTRFVGPTIVTGVTDDMRIMQEEIFGPLWPVRTWGHLDDVIATINARPKPLAFYIQANNRAIVKRLLATTSAGGTLINEYLLGNANPALPFGGVNNSGLGKSFGWHGFVDFCNERAVLERKFLDLEMVYPPYSKRVVKLARFLYKWL